MQPDILRKEALNWNSREETMICIPAPRIVDRSYNDVALVIAENVAGTEEVIH